MLKSLLGNRLLERVRTAEAIAVTAQAALDATQDMVDDMARVVSIERDGATVTILFSRHGEIHRIDVYADLGLNVAQLRKDLLE